jgi:hypothetical protein
VGISFATTYAFEARSFTLLSIDTGYHLVRMLAMAAIVSLSPV